MKMINSLCTSGVVEARELLSRGGLEVNASDTGGAETNLPQERRRLRDLDQAADRTFEIASAHLSAEHIMQSIQGWMNEDRAGALISALEYPSTSIGEIVEALRRYERARVDEAILPTATRSNLYVALVRRLLSDNLAFIRRAKPFVNVADFQELAQRLIYPSRSQGRIGGKGAGVLLAKAVLASEEDTSLKSKIKFPKTWYVISDAIVEFTHYNSLEDLYNRKYMEIESIRQDYPHVVQVFKNSRMPPELVKGLSAALDDLENRPLVVRSSSPLEDQIGAAFSGKYKSLFLANQGSKKERLGALLDAIAEVYASVLSPDPIEYRGERGLLDVREEMGILIQEVVGRKVGRYFLPSFAGVAFSHNEFRWSPRIAREDGLVRLVPGLGTRAVDRLSDDYPVLLAPGQPQLRVNVTPDEIHRYSPQKIDVINLESNRFETIDVRELLRECGEDYPLARRIVSIADHDRFRRPTGLEPDWEKDDLVVTFDGLISNSSFVADIATLLSTLHERLDMPVDIEFASDGEDLYLLQCRAQSSSPDHTPAAIPRDIPRDRLIFSANRFVSNGWIPDATHIVYVDPEGYAALGDLQSLHDVARTVGRLNKTLPKRQFVLMGPGRWGSRGDIRLGVSVSYSEINNASLLIEIARRKGSYVPELSFGTHFFQDLVEAGIRYLPLYPDEEGNAFNEAFLGREHNLLAELLPDSAHLSDVVRVIDVRQRADGRVLRVLMNAELDEAVGFLSQPGSGDDPDVQEGRVAKPSSTKHWRWRMRMAKRVAARLDGEAFGVKAMYVFGSTKNATAGPASDIDLLVHIEEHAERREELRAWFQGWSQALAEANYLRTGYRTDSLLDIHYVTDADIENRTSYAVKIGAVTDAARPLVVGTAS